jgi:hypothetical protein
VQASRIGTIHTTTTTTITTLIITSSTSQQPCKKSLAMVQVVFLDHLSPSFPSINLRISPPAASFPTVFASLSLLIQAFIHNTPADQRRLVLTRSPSLSHITSQSARSNHVVLDVNLLSTNNHHLTRAGSTARMPPGRWADDFQSVRRSTCIFCTRVGKAGVKSTERVPSRHGHGYGHGYGYGYGYGLQHL